MDWTLGGIKQIKISQGSNSGYTWAHTMLQRFPGYSESQGNLPFSGARDVVLLELIPLESCRSHGHTANCRFRKNNLAKDVMNRRQVYELVYKSPDLNSMIILETGDVSCLATTFQRHACPSLTYKMSHDLIDL